jgi:multiple sugar transport system permease protein/raffinose/stachyose/melibiose transport system permease protein
MAATPKRNAAVPALETRPLWQRVWLARAAYLLILPMFLCMIVFVYYPPFSGMYHAFFAWNPTGSSPFVGLDNFRTIVNDPHFGQEVQNMLILLFGSLVTGITMPLIVAELIYAVRSANARYAYRFLFLIPIVVPLVVGQLMWMFFYDPNIGPIDALLRAIGLGGLARDWLGDFNTALYALIFICFPWVGGTSVLIYLAGLMNISPEIVEAASLDGTAGIRRIWFIDLPLILPQIRYFVVLGLIFGLQMFQLQLIVTNPPGGPGYQTDVPSLEMYLQAFENGRFGIASAYGVMLFAVGLALCIVAMRFVRSGVTEGTV